MNNTNPELSKAEIDQLFTFVRSKYVRYTDVQYEIVDHLATAIEEEMRGDQSLSFKQALDKAYSRFPITGFSNWVEEREKLMHRYWLNRCFKYGLSYFRLPKVVLAGLIVALLFYFILYVPYGFAVLFIISLIFNIVAAIKSNRSLKNIYEEQGKMLVVQAFRSAGGSIVMPMLVGVVLGDSTRLINTDFSQGQVIALSIFFTFINISSYAVAYVFPDMLKEELREKYGHLQVV